MNENGIKAGEPTTGEIVRALRYCVGKDTICGTECPAHLSEAGCRTTVMKNAAARLESQEREIEELKQSNLIVQSGLSEQLIRITDELTALTARAEQAERERDAAINEAIRAVFYDMSDGKPALLLGEGICRYCQSDKGERIKCKSCFENGNFELRNNLRGQPQDGEGK